MKLSTPILMSAALLLAACGGAGREAPTLPETAPTKTFAIQLESLLRGVNGSYNTSPRGRPAAILNVTYTLECMSGGSPSAKQRLASAKKILDESFTVSPYYFQNPRERGQWKRAANEKVIAKTGCEVVALQDAVKTKEPVAVFKYILENRVKPVR